MIDWRHGNDSLFSYLNTAWWGYEQTRCWLDRFMWSEKTKGGKSTRFLLTALTVPTLFPVSPVQPDWLVVFPTRRRLSGVQPVYQVFQPNFSRLFLLFSWLSCFLKKKKKIFFQESSMNATCLLWLSWQRDALELGLWLSVDKAGGRSQPNGSESRW